VGPRAVLDAVVKRKIFLCIHEFIIPLSVIVGSLGKLDTHFVTNYRQAAAITTVRSHNYYC